jgi:hypothetical protein
VLYFWKNAAEGNRFSPYAFESFLRIQNNREKTGEFSSSAAKPLNCAQRLKNSTFEQRNYRGILWISPERRSNKELAATFRRIQKTSRERTDFAAGRKHASPSPFPPPDDDQADSTSQALNWIKGHVVDSPVLSRRRRST